MIDIKLIRENRKEIEKKLKTKDPDVNLALVVEYDEQFRTLKTHADSLKAKRNQFSQQIGERKRSGESADDLLQEVQVISKESHDVDHQLTIIEEKLHVELTKLPNIPMDDVPVSPDPKDNVIIKEHGERPTFNFPIKNHLELNERLQLFDFKRGAKISGTGWPTYCGLGARLEWALLNYMISVQLKNGFEQWMVPTLVRPEILFGSGQLPKFENQQFKIDDDDYHLYMIPTAEVPLNGLHYDEIFSEEELPKKYMAYTQCFRRESGAAGEKERGLIRTHQFNKIEMFTFTKPEDSTAMMEHLIASAEEVIEGLGLHYRRMLLVTGDMSFAGTRTVDLEVWLPGQDRYYEVSSITNCEDFQSRRSAIRFRRKGEKPEYVHTLNGSGLATSRLMVGLLENNQNEDGSIDIPEVLRPYLGGITKLTPSEKAAG